MKSQFHIGDKVVPSSLHVSAMLGILPDVALTVEEVIDGTKTTRKTWRGKSTVVSFPRVKADGKWFYEGDLLPA
jgi:hypothetical protein